MWFILIQISIFLKFVCFYLFEGDNLTGEFAYTYYFSFICSYEVVNLYMYRLIWNLEDISKDYTDTRVRLRNFFQNVKKLSNEHFFIFLTSKLYIHTIKIYPCALPKCAFERTIINFSLWLYTLETLCSLPRLCALSK